MTYAKLLVLEMFFGRNWYIQIPDDLKDKTEYYYKNE